MPIHRECCETVIAEYGWPNEFVDAVIPVPATFLFEYEKQRETLRRHLAEENLCEHYANQALIYLRTRCDSLVNTYAQFADYLYMTPSAFEEMLNEGFLEELLD